MVDGPGVIHVEYFEGLPKYFYLIGGERFVFDLILPLLPLLRHHVLALEFLVGGKTHDLGGHLPKDLIIDFETIFHFENQAKVIIQRCLIQALTNQMIEEDKEHSKVQLSFQSNNSIENSEMSLNIGFCALAVILKLLPIVFFFSTTSLRILGFTLVLVAAAVDFWTVKNITGKELVNMMWWMKIDLDTGEEEWMFLSNEGYQLNPINEAVFWGGSMTGNLFWGISTLLSLILSSLFWIVLCAVCFILNAINFAFFLKCRGNHQQKLKNLVDRIGLPSASRLVDF